MIKKIFGDIKATYFYIAACFMFIFSLMFPIISLNKMLAIIGLLVAVGIVMEKNITVDFAFITIAITFLLIAYIDLHAQVFTSTAFAMILPSSYVLGKLLVGNDSDKMDKRIVIAMLAITVGLLIQGFLNFYMEYQMPVFDTETWTEFWSRKEDVSRSLFEFDFIFFTSLIGIAVLGFKKHKIFSGIVFAIDIVIQIVVAKSEGRLNAGILLGVLMLTLIVYYAKGWKNYEAKTKKRIIGAVIVLLILLVVFYIVYTFNIFSLQDRYLNSYLNSSGGILHNIRFVMMAEAFGLMAQNPIGGWSVTSGHTYGQVNCVWFLFAQEYDNVIFGLFLLFELITLIQVIKLLSKKMDLIDYWLFGSYAAINVYYLMETCPWRYREYFVFLLVLNGIIKRRVELKSNPKPEKVKMYRYNNEVLDS